MKKGFWIASGVIFLALVVVYYLFVASVRDSNKRLHQDKARAIDSLKAKVNEAKAGGIPSKATVATLQARMSEVNLQAEELKTFLLDRQKNVQYVKGMKDWVYSSDEAIQYKNWYNKQRDAAIQLLVDSKFVFSDIESFENVQPKELEKVISQIGFQKWSSDTPTKEEIEDSHKKLMFMVDVIQSISLVFKDTQDVYPELSSIKYNEWMTKNSREKTKTSKFEIRLNAPYSFLNKLVGQIESTSLQLEVEDMKIMKDAKTKDYSEYPNVSISLLVKAVTYDWPETKK